MIIHFCPACNTAFEGRTQEEDCSKDIPCIKCGEDSFQLDEHLYPILKNLYRKGIETKFGCEGHWDYTLYYPYYDGTPDGDAERTKIEENCEYRTTEFYLWFKDGVTPEMFDNFKYSEIDKEDLKDGKIIIRQNKEFFRSYIDYLEYKFELIKELYEWSERL